MRGPSTDRGLHLQASGRLILLLAIPILVGLIMWLVKSRDEQQSQVVEHTLQVEVALERMMLRLEDAGRGKNVDQAPGFQRSDRLPENAADAIEQEFANLSSLTADNSRQMANLARLKPLLDRRLTHLVSALDGENQGVQSVEEQQRLLDSIRSITSDMYQEEDRLLNMREAALRRATVQFNWALFLGYGLIVLVVGSLNWSVKRHSRETAEAQDTLSRLNAELDERVRRRTEELHAREEQLNIFVKHVPAGVAMLDRDMRYLQVSDRWCVDYGISREKLVGSSHYDLFPDIPDEWKEIHRRGLAGESMKREEDRWDRADGTTKWLHWEIRPWGSQDGLPKGLLVFGEDITARKEVEELLRTSEATTRTLLDTASQGVLAVNSAGTVVIANRKASEMFGYDVNELIGSALEILLPEHLRERHCAHRAGFNSNPKPRAMGSGMDLVGLRKNGIEFPIDVSLSSLETKDGLLAVSFVSDITDRKQAENDLKASEQQLRALAASLLTAQEEERRKLARELHDDLTQQLAFLAIELGRLASALPERSEERERVAALKVQASRTSDDVRRLSHGLHPSVITDFGLGIALEEFCNEFERAHDVNIEFEGLTEEFQLDDLGATCLYRVAQEGLRNAVVHGRAKNIRVTLSAEDGFLQLRVSDDGIGFCADPMRSKSGLGVISMTERMRLIGGTLKLEVQPGGGTMVTARVPVTGDDQ